MANIAFNVGTGNEKLIQESDKLIEELKRRGAKTNIEAYEQMVHFTMEHLDAVDIRAAGGNIDAIEKSFENIRSQFRSLAHDKSEIQAGQDAVIAELKTRAAAEIEDLKMQLSDQKDKAALARANAETAIQEADRAKEDAANARMQTESMQALIDAKDDKIAGLREQLEAANKKLKGYDELKEERDQLERELTDTRHEMEKAALQAQLDIQKAQEELARQVAALEAEIKVLREVNGQQFQ